MSLFGNPPPGEPDLRAAAHSPGERLFFAIALSLDKVGDHFLRERGWKEVLPHERPAWEEAAKLLGIEETETQ